MGVRFAFALLAAVLPISAQDLVYGKVTDDATGVPLGGAKVVLFTHQAARYQATSDDQGVLHFPALDPGEYRATVEKSGYFVVPDAVIKVGGATPPNLNFKLRSGMTGKGSLRGQVLDPDGAPIGGARVDLIRGPASHVTITADADGRFAFDKLPSGAYKLRAVPPPTYTGPAVATYFPGTLDEPAAQRIVVVEETEIDGFRLAAPSVFRVQGIVRDESGNPVEGAIVKRMASFVQPIHVVASSAPIFVAMDAGPDTSLEEEEFTTSRDGRFEFRNVRAGSWQIVAQGPSKLDPLTGFDNGLSGAASIDVRANVAEIDVWAKSPATLNGRSRWTIAQCALRTGCGPVDARPAPTGIVYPIWLQSFDGQASSLGLGITQSDETLQLRGALSGRFVLVQLPGIAPQGLPKDAHLSPHSVLPIFLVTSASRARPKEPLSVEQRSILDTDGGGYFDPDGTKPLLPPSRQFGVSGTIRGHVDGGDADTSVVILSRNPSVYRGQLLPCQPNGDFELRNLPRDEYYVAAFHSVDFEVLRDPEILRKLIAEGQTVVVKGDSDPAVRLTELPWF